MTPFPSTPCIEFEGKSRANGYGLVNRRGRGHSPQLAHRWAYEQVHGPIPKGKVIMHLCDNRLCINVEHLKMGTQSENLRMAYERGMPPRGCCAPGFRKKAS